MRAQIRCQMLLCALLACMVCSAPAWAQLPPVQTPPQNPFTLAFLDPPYGRGLAEKALASLNDGVWLAAPADGEWALSGLLDFGDAFVGHPEYDFIGFGLPPGSPSLGEMLQQGKNNLQAPWLGFTGFLSIATLLTLLVFAGEAVRDAFDPRKTLA